MENKKLLTGYEVDSILRYAQGRAERLARRGKLPHVLLPGGDIRFRADDIENLIHSQALPGGKAVSHD